MSNQELNLFKDEILKKLRELETKFFKELSKKSFEININYENFNEKVNSILESNKILIDSSSNQKLQIEKINNLELAKKEIEEKLITQEIRINNISNEIKKMKFNYDKIISENLIIPSYIGPGSKYKSLGDFIINAVDQFEQFKEEKDALKNLNIELKTKMDVMIKNMKNFIEMNSSRCIAYTDSMQKEYQLKLEDKFKQLDEKSIESNQHIYSNQIKFEEKLKEIGDKIGKISNNNEKLLIFDKFQEIKKTEEEMNQKLQKAINEVKDLKMMKEQLSDQVRKINLKIEDINRNTQIKYTQQKIINKEIFNKNKKNNFNSYANMLYTNNNNINYLNEKQNMSKINDLPNLSNIIKQYSSNPKENKESKENKEKIQIFRNEKRIPILNCNSKTEEEYKENKIKALNDEEKFINENNFRKSANNIFTDTNINTKDTNFKIINPCSENFFLSPKATHYNSKIRIKDKLYKESLNNIKQNLKDNKKRFIFDFEVKNNYSDRKKNANIGVKIRDIRKGNKDIENFGKTCFEYYKKNQNNLNIKENMVEKPFINSHKKKQNILIQTSNLDRINKNIKEDLLNEINNEDNNNDTDNFINARNIQNTQGNVNVIECNIVNLNMLDLPKNKKNNITSLNEYLEKSTDNRIQNKKKSIINMESKKHIKIFPTFGRTTYSFYNNKDTGELINNGNLYNNLED